MLGFPIPCFKGMRPLTFQLSSFYSRCSGLRSSRVYLGSCQNYGPFLGTLILTTTHLEDHGASSVQAMRTLIRDTSN